MEKNDERRKKNEEIWIHTKNPLRFQGFTVVAVTFSSKSLTISMILFRMCLFSFLRKINNPFCGVTFFKGKVAIFIGRETKMHIFRRKSTKKIAKVSPSNNNYSLRIILAFGPCFLEPLVLAAICPCALRQSTAALGRISSIFYVKSGLGSPCSSHLEIWNYFYEQYLAATKPPVPASVYVAFGRISHIFIVLVVPASLRSSHLKIWTLFLLAVIWRWEVGFRRH